MRLSKVIGHGTVGLTACPGEALAVDVPRIRRLVQAKIEASGGVTPTTPPDGSGGGITPK